MLGPLIFLLFENDRPDRISTNCMLISDYTKLTVVNVTSGLLQLPWVRNSINLTTQSREKCINDYKLQFKIYSQIIVKYSNIYFWSSTACICCIFNILFREHVKHLSLKIYYFYHIFSYKSLLVNRSDLYKYNIHKLITLCSFLNGDILSIFIWKLAWKYLVRPFKNSDLIYY